MELTRICSYPGNFSSNSLPTIPKSRTVALFDSHEQMFLSDSPLELVKTEPSELKISSQAISYLPHQESGSPPSSLSGSTDLSMTFTEAHCPQEQDIEMTPNLNTTEEDLIEDLLFSCIVPIASSSDMTIPREETVQGYMSIVKEIALGARHMLQPINISRSAE